jgi:thymidylate synthase
MKQYLDLVRYLLKYGEKKDDRTGTGVVSVFGYQNRYNLKKGFPLLTTKKVFFSSLLHELLWFIQGKTNIYDGLKPHTSIWDPWADKNGDLGPIYGYQWRNWEKFSWDQKNEVYQKTYIDQLKQAIDLIKNQPNSRRIIINAWNVGDLDRMALPPCHMFFQFYVFENRLDCQLYQRSADIALGVPFNIASYALLLIMIAQECNLAPGFFIHTFGDVHIYLNHIEGLKEQLQRKPKKLPEIKVAPKSLFDLSFKDFDLIDYQPDPYIKFPIAV